MQEHISIHLAANHSDDQSNKENVFLTLLRWAVQGKGIRGSLSSLRTYIFHVLLLHILGDFCTHTVPSYHQWVTVAPKFPLLYLWEKPFPLLLLRSLVVFSIPWQVSLWPQWSKLHLSLSPKHISQWEQNDHTCLKQIKIHLLGLEEAYASLKYMAKIWINQDLRGKKEGKQWTVYTHLLKPSSSWMTIHCSFKELTHRIMCFKRTTLLSAFTLMHMDKF